MFDSTRDILFLILSIAIATLTIFLSVTLYHFIRVLRDVEKLTEHVEEAADRVNRYVARPTRLLTMLITKGLKLAKMFAGFQEKKTTKKKKSGSKKKKASKKKEE